MLDLDIEKQSGAPNNPIRVFSLLGDGLSTASRSFKEALVNSKGHGKGTIMRETCDLKSLSIPCSEGGNIIVDVDDDDYNQKVDELQFSLVGRLFLLKSNSTPITMTLRAKLVAVGVWRVSS